MLPRKATAAFQSSFSNSGKPPLPLFSMEFVLEAFASPFAMGSGGVRLAGRWVRKGGVGFEDENVAAVQRGPYRPSSNSFFNKYFGTVPHRSAPFRNRSPMSAVTEKPGVCLAVKGKLYEKTEENEWRRESLRVPETKPLMNANHANRHQLRQGRGALVGVSQVRKVSGKRGNPAHPKRL